MGKAKSKARQRIKMGKSRVKANNWVKEMVRKTNKKRAKSREKTIEQSQKRK